MYRPTSYLKAKRWCDSRTRTKRPSEVTRESCESTFNKLLDQSRRGRFRSSLAAATTPRSPDRVQSRIYQGFARLYEVGRPLGQWKSGL